MVSGAQRSKIRPRHIEPLDMANIEEHWITVLSVDDVLISLWQSVGRRTEWWASGGTSLKSVGTRTQWWASGGTSLKSVGRRTVW